MSTDYLRVKLLTATSIKPRRATSGSAGYDISSNESVVIVPGTRALIGTGISVEVSPHYYIRIAPRSGLSTKCIDLAAGVVDSDYRGELKVLLVNNSRQNFNILPGERIAQLIVERIITPEIEVVDTHISTVRGDGGFGSTGVSGYTGLSEQVVYSER